jgi:predicted metal-dependent enzyme (double-stranded beta helix superfamily)
MIERIENIPRPHGHDLSEEELLAVAREFAAQPELWSEHVAHDPTQRTYRQLLRDEHLDVWLLCWSHDHDTGFHDHDLSSGAVVVAQGAVVEERLRLGGPPSVRRYVPGDVFEFSPVDIHRVTHAGTTPATTIHAYSPPLRRMGAYLIQPGGTLERHPLAKDQELRPLNSAA